MDRHLATIFALISYSVFPIMAETRRLNAFCSAPVSFRALALNLAYIVGRQRYCPAISTEKRLSFFG